MNLNIWLSVLARSIGASLIAQGKVEQGQLLLDAASAARAGRNVDDIMEQIAKDWEEHGEPSFDQIEARRKAIQARL